jgi:arsenate reductase (thioredoxin)
MNQKVSEYISQCLKAAGSISETRKDLLDKLVVYLQNKHSRQKETHLIYICTHNSRRSHFGQVWASIAAEYFGFHRIKIFSGGTEATRVHANTITALQRAGLEVNTSGNQNNANVEINYDGLKPIVCFSKAYDHVTNPQKEFAAIMTCSEAEENCPFIPGAEFRLGTTYTDPKAFDGTADQDKAYDACCKQIASECLYVFSKLKH